MSQNIFQKLSRVQQLETDRLILRPVTLEDAEDMFLYASDEENVRWSFQVNESLEDTKDKIASFYLANPLGRWGIALKESNQLIGTIDLLKLVETVGRAEIGYTLNKAYWNQGYMTEAVHKIVKVFFENLGMNCLFARHDSENPASGRVMQKVGLIFSHEEPYAKVDPKDPHRMVTMVHYRLTKEEYFKGEQNYV